MTPPEYFPIDEWMKEHLQMTGACRPVEKEYIGKNGVRIPVMVGVVQLAPGDDTYVCFVLDVMERRRAMEALTKAYDELELRVDERTSELKQEIGRREQAEAALRSQTLTDPLTGLYNRRGFMALASQHLQLARRKHTGSWLVMADVDYLKPINDTFGHAEGDRALIQAGTLLKQIFRESDIVARIGGDEFAVVAIEDSEQSDRAISVRLQEKLDDYNRYSGQHYQLGLSVGAVRMDPAENATIEQLMNRADAVLYEKKRERSPASGPPMKKKR